MPLRREAEYYPAMDFNEVELEAQLLESLVRYVCVETTSKQDGDAVPSTPGQWQLLKMLQGELQAAGAAAVTLTDAGFLMATVPASKGREGSGTVGFMAHVDTSSAVSAKDVNPQVHRSYDGGDIRLSDDLVLSPGDFPELLRYKGSTIVTTDGSTLLGADDKAGVAEIMTAASWLLAHPDVSHGAIELIFTPDEETGKGMDLFPLDLLQSRRCYTLDGDMLGAVETECFNARKAEIEFLGRPIHPGTARGKLVNATTMVSTFVSMLPRNESPEATDGTYGFYMPSNVHGDIERATVSLIMRDFEEAGIERREAAVRAIAAAVEHLFSGGRVTVTVEKQYTNMRYAIEKDPRVVDHLIEAIHAAGIEPVRKPIRGGTDGARLCEKGIPAPNIFTGGHNYHSRLEWAALPAMVKATEVIINLATLWAGEPE